MSDEPIVSVSVMQRIRSILWVLLLLIIIALVIELVRNHPVPAHSRSQPAAVASSTESIATTTAATSSAQKKSAATSTPVKVSTAEKPSNRATDSTSPSNGAIATRVQDAYSTKPFSFDEVNVAARAAVVNIMCLPRSGGGLHPISGSGVIIDSRGIILTNSHVAQYVLLSESPSVDLRCYIRNGSPAAIRWTPSVLFMPRAWVQLHAAELNQAHPSGTGEHDYALLYISASADGSPLPASFPALVPDTREGIGFTGDSALVASYPAEFVGDAARNDLYAAASVTTIGPLLTFGTSSVDAISVGGVIEAQSGSSGGAVVNAWERLIGIITTTSSGQTTAQRDLRAITLSYINRDLKIQSGLNLAQVLASDPAELTAQFTKEEAPSLLALLTAQLR